MTFVLVLGLLWAAAVTTVGLGFSAYGFVTEQNGPALACLGVAGLGLGILVAFGLLLGERRSR